MLIELRNDFTSGNEEVLHVNSPLPLSNDGSNSNVSNKQVYQSTRMASSRTSTLSTSSSTTTSSMGEIQYNAEQKVEVMVEKQVE